MWIAPHLCSSVNGLFHNMYYGVRKFDMAGLNLAIVRQLSMKLLTELTLSILLFFHFGPSR